MLTGNKMNKFSCEKCDKKFSGHSGLLHHNAAVHQGISYPCEECDYKATRRGPLRDHIKKVHNW